VNGEIEDTNIPHFGNISFKKLKGTNSSSNSDSDRRTVSQTKERFTHSSKKGSPKLNLFRGEQNNI
jgi:hypothetical protein